MEKENTRFKNGLNALQNIDGTAGQNVMDSLTGDSKDIAKYIVEFAFGDIYTRNSLNLKQREMITITALLVQGDTAPQLNVHINGALNVSLSETEVIETFIQCIPYIGFPKVLNAVSVAHEVFKTRN
ncbi:carboxymuconolactone decarboxylase family protein [Furfurilactobacillus curtus]|uniref:4-carboxymuconolactone decarboxylase n=1 Tax=Furfurilactobacillus curtus TaxID=1746200 RepID=A0ABQ5JLY5_9LACO